MNNIDPDGEFFQFIVGAAAAIGGAAVDAAIQGVQIATGERASFDGLQTLRAGAISGATGLAAATCGACAVAVAGGLSGAEQAGVALVQGDSAGEALAKGAIGATIGAVTAGKGAGLGTNATAGLAVKALKGEVPVSAPFAAQSAISAGASQGLTNPLNEAGGALVDGASQGLSDLGNTLSDHGTELVNSIKQGCGVTPSGPC